MNPASSPSAFARPAFAEPDRRFGCLSQRQPSQANRGNVGGGAGKPSRSRPYVAPSRDHVGWATPMRGVPPVQDRGTTGRRSQSPGGSPAPMTPQQPAFPPARRSQSRGVSLAHTGNSPDEGRRLSQREKQVSYGYVTDGYKNMIRLVEHDPLLRCGEILPLSPPDVQRGSKRIWDIQLRKWRRALHMFDYVFIDGEDDESRRADVIEQQRLQWVNIAFMAPPAVEEGKTAAANSAATTPHTEPDSDTAPPAAVSVLRPAVDRVRLSLETLMAVRSSPLVPTKLPVEDELRCILVSDDCFESVRNVVPQTASSLTRGTDISPLEAGIKIHIAPSAAVLRQQQEQQQRHQDTLQHARLQSPPAVEPSKCVSLASPHAGGRGDSGASPSLPATVVGGGGCDEQQWWRRAASHSMPDRASVAPVPATPCAQRRAEQSVLSPCHPWPAALSTTTRVSADNGACSPAPRPPASRGVNTSPAASPGAWSPSPVLAPPPPFVRNATLHSPSPVSHAAPVQFEPRAVMVMMPTMMPDGTPVMMVPPMGFYADPHAMAVLSPPPHAAAATADPHRHVMPPPAFRPSASAPRWNQSQSRPRGGEPQTVPRFVPMLSASKEEVRLAERMGRPHPHAATPGAAIAASPVAHQTSSTHRGDTSALPPSPDAVHPSAAHPATRHDNGNGQDAQRALFVAADEDDETLARQATVPRGMLSHDDGKAQAEAGDASLLKVATRRADSESTWHAPDDVSQRLFGQ